MKKVVASMFWKYDLHTPYLYIGPYGFLSRQFTQWVILIQVLVESTSLSEDLMKLMRHWNLIAKWHFKIKKNVFPIIQLVLLASVFMFLVSGFFSWFGPWVPSPWIDALLVLTVVWTSCQLVRTIPKELCIQPNNWHPRWDGAWTNWEVPGDRWAVKEPCSNWVQKV